MSRLLTPRRLVASGLAAGCLLAGTALVSPASAHVPAQTTSARAVLAPGVTVRVGADAAAVSDPLAHPEGPGSPTPGTATRGTLGEGLVRLTMDAPGTSWGSAEETADVVQVAVDGGQPQEVVLFAGSSPFTYEGFLGPLRTGPHAVDLTVRRDLSRTTVPRAVRLESLQLVVVPASSPDYLAEAYAPVLYGRQASGRAYTPLLTDVAVTALGDGSHRLDYVYVISAHDQGDSVVPAYQWGLWGRMTDIVSMLSETVAPGGQVTSATYASCGCESLPAYPDAVMAPQETTAPFAGTWYGTHPVLRDATATNYLSDRGTTPYRFQQAPVAAPGPGELRDAVMDQHPWTYEISDEELPREHPIDTSPRTPLVGDYRQYAIVDADLSVTGASSVEVDVRLAGSPTWYSSDYRQTASVPTTFPFHTGGHWRTVVKLPMDWGSRAVTGIRLRLDAPPGQASPTVTVHGFGLLDVTPAWTVVPRRTPALQVVSGVALVPVSLPG